MFKKGGGERYQGNHAEGKQGGAEKFFTAQFLGIPSYVIGFVLRDECDEDGGNSHEGSELKQVAPAQHVDANGGAGRVVEQLRGLFGR